MFYIKVSNNQFMNKNVITMMMISKESMLIMRINGTQFLSFFAGLLIANENISENFMKKYIHEVVPKLVLN